MKKLAAFMLVIMMLVISGCSANNAASEGDKQTSKAVPTEAKSTDNPQPAEAAKEQTPAPSQAAQKGTANNTSTQKTTPTPSVEKKDSFTLSITENKGSKVILNKKIDISLKKPLMEYLKAEASVIEEGGFIKSINGISSISASKLTSEQKKAGVLGVDWFVYVNGKKALVGAYDVFPKSGELINLDFKEWTYQDYGP
jgi:hypothetical protein